MSPSKTTRWRLVFLAALLVCGLWVQQPQLEAPLLEGAAGKQTHTAMIARNLQTGKAVFTRPVIDDIGEPGYFIKEIPLVPQLAAWTSDATSLSIDTSGRLLGLMAWLIASTVFYWGLSLSLPSDKALLATFWTIFAPLAFAYAPAFQNDTTAVLLSLGSWLALVYWRRRVDSAKTLFAAALMAAGLSALALLLKPHVVFWLAPAAVVLVFGGRDRPAARQWVPLAISGTLGGALASLWYLHAAEIHQTFPTPGATVTEGWVDFTLLGAPYFWKELARQLGLMVFTPIGLGLTFLGLTRRSPRNLAEWSLLAWGAGVLLQDLVFATRFSDQLSHGTEYYNLALVPVAGLMISDGILQIRDRAGRLGPFAVAAAMVALATSSPFLAREARTPPAAYGALLEDCNRVRELSDPGDPFLVFADRAGTILYYCQRRGTTFALGNPDPTRGPPKGPLVSRSQMDQAARAAEFAYFPFPDQVQDPAFLASFASQWQELDMGPSPARLYRRRNSR